MTQPDKPYTTKPTSQLDLEARVERDHLPVKPNVDPNEVNAPYAVEGNDTSDYIGVSSEYMTYASETEGPLAGDGLEAEVTEEQLSGYAFTEKKVDQPGGGQTVGGGSEAPVVGAVTSGESVSTKIVEKDEVATTAKAVKDDSTPAPTKAPAKATAPSTTSNS